MQLHELPHPSAQLPDGCGLYNILDTGLGWAELSDAGFVSLGFLAVLLGNSENLAKVDGVGMVCILEGVLKAAMLKGSSLLPPARICMRHPSTQKNLFCGRMICFDQS